MTEANLDFQHSWPSYQSHELAGVLSSYFGEVCTQFHKKKQLHTYLATPDATPPVSEVDKVCTQFEEKPAVHLPR